MNPLRPQDARMVAVHTPFHADGSLAPELVHDQARFLSEQGLHCVFITGTTGESHALAHAEKRRLYEAWSEVSRLTGIRVVAHVGGNCLEEAMDLAGLAQDLGFAACSALVPTYFKPRDVGSAVACCRRVASGAPGLPFYYYDIPQLTGVQLPLDDFIRLARRIIPTFSGVKYSGGDLAMFRRGLEAAGSEQGVLWGSDETWASARMMGAWGAVGSTYNWSNGLFRRMDGLLDAGDWVGAGRCQALVMEMVETLSAAGYLGMSKALMTRLGVPVGPVRLPLSNPTPDQVDAVMARLERLGFAEWGPAAGGGRVGGA